MDRKSLLLRVNFRQFIMKTIAFLILILFVATSVQQELNKTAITTQKPEKPTTTTEKQTYTTQQPENQTVQWLAEKLDFLEVCDITWGYFEWELHTLKVLLCNFLS